MNTMLSSEKKSLRTTGLLLTIVVSLLLASCGGTKREESPQLRLGNFLWDAQQVTIDIYRESEQQDSITLSYGTLTSYRSLEPGRYRIRVSSEKQALLEKTFGMGSNESYTLVIAGITSGPQELNKQTLSKKLHTLVEGNAVSNSNGYLPQILLINDFFVKEKKKGQFRIINLMPGTANLHGKVLKGHKQEFSETLKYFHSSHTRPVPVGELELELSFTDSPLTFSREPVTIREKALNSFFIIPRKGHYLTSPRVVTGITGDSH